MENIPRGYSTEEQRRPRQKTSQVPTFNLLPPPKDGRRLRNCRTRFRVRFGGDPQLELFPFWKWLSAGLNGGPLETSAAIGVSAGPGLMVMIRMAGLPAKRRRIPSSIKGVLST